ARIISGLGNRRFLLNNVHDERPELFETRWALSYLRGPLTRIQIKTLMDPVKTALSALTSSPAALETRTAASLPRKAPGPPMEAGPSDANAHPPVLPPGIHQSFLPVRPRTNKSSTLVYEPRIFGTATVHVRDNKTGLEETRELSILIPITNNNLPLDWNQAALVNRSADDLDLSPVEHSTFTQLPAPANDPKRYRAWEKDLVDWIYRNYRLELWESPSLRAISMLGESERDFCVRLQILAHEARDSQTEILRKKYTPKFAALEERIRRAEQIVGRETEQAQHQKWQTAISFGATLLSAFLGRKAVTTT